MSRLALTFAGEPHFDRTRLLETGEVRPDGIDLNCLRVEVGELFRRMAQFAEFDVSEMSMSTLMAMVSRGDDRLVGLPVFPSRHFRHRQIYVRADAGIAEPKDLAGRTVGVPEYQMTAALWHRAVLEHDFGVAPSDMTWVYGGLNRPHYRERLALPAPPGVRMRAAPADRTLNELLESGELDALLSTQPPTAFHEGDPRIVRLFEDYRAVERDWWERTRLFPIMHCIVMRRDVYEANRWIAVSLLEAFAESRALLRAQLHHPDTPPVTHPWWHAEIEDVFAMFGGDPWYPGYDANAATLEAMTAYSFEQGLSARKLDPQELFAPESVAVDL
jgi:4,5-dihydroxyphthalate decarboxylase